MTVNTTTKAFSQNFAKKVGATRKSLGLSRRGIARIMGVSDSTIRRIEASRKIRRKTIQGYSPNMSTVIKFAEAINVEPGEFVQGFLEQS